MASVAPLPSGAASYLAFVLPLTPDDVLRYRNGGGATPESREEWRQIQTAQRLAWQHGFASAATILAGRDPEANTDLAKWRSLGGAER